MDQVKLLLVAEIKYVEKVLSSTLTTLDRKIFQQTLTSLKKRLENT